MSALTISIVTYHPDTVILERVLGQLAESVRLAIGDGMLDPVSLLVVDNSVDRETTNSVRRLVGAFRGAQINNVQVIASDNNVGYGAAHNLAFCRLPRGDYHLVLNPDALLAPDALTAALDFMAAHPRVGLLAPSVAPASGVEGHLCRRYPGLIDLCLRGAAPHWLRRRFERRLAHYEMRDLPADRSCLDVPIASGCCMLCRSELYARIGGFSERFFLYFEDFDLSLRLRRHALIAYVPAVRIVHLGGGAARKGLRHIGLFARSAFTFFSIHGWRS